MIRSHSAFPTSQPQPDLGFEQLVGKETASSLFLQGLFRSSACGYGLDSPGLCYPEGQDWPFHSTLELALCRHS